MTTEEAIVEAAQLLSHAIDQHADKVADALHSIAIELRGIGQEIGPGGHESLGGVFKDIAATMAEWSPGVGKQ